MQDPPNSLFAENALREGVGHLKTSIQMPAKGGGLMLLAGLLVLLLVAHAMIRPSDLPNGPRVGAPLPDFLVQRSGQSDAVSLRGVLTASGCSLLIVASTKCPTCARMRVTWPSRFTTWADSLYAAITPIWLVSEGASDWQAFVEGFDLAEVEAVFPAEDPSEVIDGLGVIGTPTVYVVDANGNLTYGLIGDRLPSGDVVREACL